MLGTKQMLDKKGSFVSNRGEDWWWDALTYSVSPEIDWEWEARDKFNEKLAYRFVNERDLWEDLEVFVRDDLTNAKGIWRDDELLDYLVKNGIMVTSADYDLYDWIHDFICDDEDRAQEYVEWLK